MVTSNILRRTFYVKYGKYVGTAFAIEKGNRQFLVSTNHTFPFLDHQSEFTFYIHHDGDWRETSAKIFTHEADEVDVVLISLEKPICNPQSSPISLTAAGLELGADAYFIGYPYGRFMDDTSYINAGYPIPYVKKATLSTLEIPDGALNAFYLDGINNVGFSGGPCVRMRSPTDVQVFGVIKGYIPNELTFNSPLGPITCEENSGIIEVHSISHIHEIKID